MEVGEGVGSRGKREKGVGGEREHARACAACRDSERVPASASLSRITGVTLAHMNQRLCMRDAACSSCGLATLGGTNRLSELALHELVCYMCQMKTLKRSRKF